MVRVFAFCVLSAVTAGALAQPAVINREAVRPFFEKLASGRADVVAIGDSNQLHIGYGWDYGWNLAVGRRFGMYATGLVAMGEGAGAGGGSGHGFSSFPTFSSHLFDYTGAPAALDRYLNNPPSLLGPQNYLYLPEGRSVSGTINAGMSIAPECAVSVNTNLRFHFTYGLFEGSGTGSFRPYLRRDAPPFNMLAQGPALSTRTNGSGPARVLSGSIDLPQARRSFPIGLRFAGPSESIIGPFLTYHARVEDLRAARGASFHTLYAVGSQSARDMAAALRASSDETLGLYFSKVREVQDEPRRVLVRVCSALNDRAEDLPSVNGVTPGNGPAAYEDNLRAIIARISQIWSLNQWDPEELYFLLTPSHPVANPDEPIMIAYRERAEAVAVSTPRTVCVRLDRLTTADEMLANVWYAQNGFDRNHLTPAAYEGLAERELLSLVALRCRADFNGDGGVDGADVDAYFAAWRTGDMLTDVNDDGGVDGADVERFFELWAGAEC